MGCERKSAWMVDSLRMSGDKLAVMERAGLMLGDYWKGASGKCLAYAIAFNFMTCDQTIPLLRLNNHKRTLRKAVDP